MYKCIQIPESHKQKNFHVRNYLNIYGFRSYNIL